MNTTGELVMHLTSVHCATDIRIYRKECRSLANAGYRVLLLAPVGSEDKEFPTSPVELVPIPRARSRFFRITCYWAIVLWKALQENAALYQAHDPELLPTLALLRLLGRTVIFDMHENVPKSLLSRHWIPVWARRVSAAAYRSFERQLLRGIPVIFAADSLSPDYMWVTESATVRNYPVLEHLSGISEQPHSVPTAIYLGAVAPERGSVTIVEAVIRCWQRGVKMDLELVGLITDQHRAELMNLVPKDAPGELRITGYVSPDEGWRRLARAHIGLAVLHRTPSYVEAMPTKILEYMMLAKPIVASDFELYRGIVEDANAGICVAPEDMDAVSAAIERLVHDPEYAAELGRRGRLTAQTKYCWNQEMKKLDNLYRRLIERACATDFLAFTTSVSPRAAEGPKRELPGEYEFEEWRPTLRRPLIPTMRGFSVVWLMFHLLRIFRSREYWVQLIRHRGVVVHRSCVFPAHFRWPFMSPEDVQVASTWTHPAYRGQGLATLAINRILERLGRKRLKVWYITRTNNPASIAVCVKAGFSLRGHAERRPSLGLSALSRWALTSAKESV